MASSTKTTSLYIFFTNKAEEEANRANNPEEQVKSVEVESGGFLPKWKTTSFYTFLPTKAEEELEKKASDTERCVKTVQVEIRELSLTQTRDYFSS